ncbi:MAG: tetratricopeptide repeat protein [Cyanobacteria bacterium SZAS LIN-3]|nr:tetratricopeptide repeat protein [Cyanobacteria bacterium SZAS LIN-3]
MSHKTILRAATIGISLLCISALLGGSALAEIPNPVDVIKGRAVIEEGSTPPAPTTPSISDKLEALIQKTEGGNWERLQQLGKDAFAQGYYEEAEKQFLAAIRELKKTNLKDERLLKSRIALGQAYLRDGKYYDAEEAFTLAQGTANELGKSKSLEYVKTMEGLAQVYKANEKYPKAEQALKTAITMRRQLQGADTLGVAQDTLDLGELYRTQKLYDQAAPFYNLALESLGNQPDAPDHVKTYFLDRTGMMYQEAGNIDLARRCFEPSIVLKERHMQLDAGAEARKKGLVYFRCVDGAPNSKSVFNRGVQIEFIRVKGAAAVATLTAQIYGPDWYIYKAEVTVQNQSNGPIQLLAEQPTLTIETPKAKTLLPLDSDAISAELGSRGQALFNRLLHSADFDYIMTSSGLGVSRTAVITPFGVPAVFNTVGSWTQFTPDWDARLRARDAAMSALARSNTERSNVLHTKPAQTTLEPGQSATFQIFYPYDKFDTSTLRLLLGNTVLEFPFTKNSG